MDILVSLCKIIRFIQIIKCSLGFNEKDKCEIILL